jgi:hypothetical protein
MNTLGGLCPLSSTAQKLLYRVFVRMLAHRKPGHRCPSALKRLHLLPGNALLALRLLLKKPRLPPKKLQPPLPLLLLRMRKSRLRSIDLYPLGLT